ncbi:MAG: hypothetical protein JW751_08440, partial [Polyangiaceae bacterium]|nr:hypothetical protein [Polyangiaceae bacterium]
MTLANRAVWMLTGNNVRLSTGPARRCVRIRIDAGTDRPWRRAAFKHPDLLRWLRQERGAVIHAALTLIQSWLDRGRPPGKERLGSFESWAEVMGSILNAAGVEGFLGNLDSLHEAADEEGSLWRDFVAVWWMTHQDRPVCVADRLSLCQSADLMVSVIGEGTEKSQVTKLGTALQSARDRVFGEHRVPAVRDPRMKRSHFRLEPVSRRKRSGRSGLCCDSKELASRTLEDLDPSTTRSFTWRSPPAVANTTSPRSTASGSWKYSSIVSPGTP